MQFKSINEQVYEYVMRQIRYGKYNGGDKVSESTLAEAFNISRTPIREALSSLVDDGVLVFQKNKGFYVKEINHEELVKKHEIIAQLDAFAAKLALPNLKEEHFIEMENYIIRMDLAIDQKSYEFYDDTQEAFHNVYFNVCSNEYVIPIIKDLQKSIIRMTVRSDDENALFKRLREYNEEHRQILQAFKDGDKDRVSALLLVHGYSPDTTNVFY